MRTGRRTGCSTRVGTWRLAWICRRPGTGSRGRAFGGREQVVAADSCKRKHKSVVTQVANSKGTVANGWITQGIDLGLDCGKGLNRCYFILSGTVKYVEGGRVAGCQGSKLKIKGGTMIEWTQVGERSEASWISDGFQRFRRIRRRESIVKCCD
jgi:hypothetical protein